MINEKLILDQRLGSAAMLVPEGAVLLDVGTDHGYLPTKLLLEGKIIGAGASDINADPLDKAVNTAEKYGVSEKMKFYLSDGLVDVPDISRYTAISICGMGGELIARIISGSEYIRRERIPLILQPMSSPEKLSEYLSDEGFRINNERIAYAAGKVYRVILAVYDGEKRLLSPVEHIIGRVNIEKGCRQDNYRLLLQKYIVKYKRMIEGKRAGGIDDVEDTAILSELYAIAEKEGFTFENI